MARTVYLKETTNFLKFMTMNPVETKNWYTRVLYECWKILVAGSVTIYFVQSILELIFLDEFILNIHGYHLFTIGACGDGLFTILYFRWAGGKQAVIRDIIREKFKYSSQDGVEKRTMENAVKYSKYITIYWTTQCAISGIIIGIWPLFGSTERILPLPARYPYDWTKSPYYEITILIQVFTNTFFILGIVSGDFPITCLTLHISDQFQILCCDIRNLVYNTLLNLGCDIDEVKAYREGFLKGDTRVIGAFDEVVRSERFKRVSEMKFRKCIELHKLLLDVTDKMEDLYAFLALVKSATWIFFIIFITFSFVKSKCSPIFLCFGLVLYLMEVLTNLFFYSYAGHMIVQNIEDLYDSLYSVPWYVCSKKIQWAVLFMQMRCKKGSKFTVGKMFLLNMNFFANIVKSGASYFIALNQFS